MADQLPTRMLSLPGNWTPPSAPPAEPEQGGLRVGELWGVLRRNWWVILGAMLLAAGGAGAYAFKATPVYQAGTTIRVERQEANLPGIFRELTNGMMGVGTEIEVLKSRSLAEEAIKQLGLRLVVTEPAGIPRSRLLQNVRVAADFPAGKFRLENRDAGGFRLCRLPTESRLPPECIGEQPLDSSLNFSLTPEARRYRFLELQVQKLEETALSVRQNLTVALPNKDAQIVQLTYQDVDPELVWQVPNTIARRFIEIRQDTQTGQATSAVTFLRQQLDTLAVQLRSSENELRQFRERERVVDPATEASTQVTQFVGLQAQRSAIDGERSALSRLLQEVEDSAARAQPDQPSPYRRLLAFPTLIGNQSASDRLQALAVLEDQRAALLGRRTMNDVDVRALTERIESIETDLKVTVTTYLQGLGNQVASLDSSIQQYDRRLAQVPDRQQVFARLQRQPKVLEEMYALLQTRLKEAEISAAVRDNSIRVVDEAVEPLLPVSPRKGLLVLGGLVGGLLFGISLAFGRELLDRSIHTRSDVVVATGLPVLGLIPKIRARGKYAVIAERVSKNRLLPHQAPKPLPRPTAPQVVRPRYTFFESQEVSPPPVQPPSPAAAEKVDLATLMTIPGTGTLVTEAYGTLQTNLIYTRGDAPLRTIVFTSALPGEGKTTNAVNLALTIAQRGVKVVLVDADVRRGVAHQLFGAKREPGLSEVLAGEVALGDALHAAKVEDGGTLHFLAAGRPPRNPVAMLESPNMRQLIAHLEEQFEAVILDSPPVNILTDAAVLAANADGVVVVVRAGQTETAALEYAMHQLELARVRVLGVVLNDVDFKRDVGYDSTYRYYQYESYTSRSKA